MGDNGRRDGAPGDSGALRELTRSAGQLGLQRIALLLLGAMRTKIAAAVLGPSGMGILAQASMLQDLLRQFVELGTGRGFLKLVAEDGGRRDRRHLERLIVTAGSVAAGLTAALGVGCVALSGPLAARVFGDPAYAPLVVLVAAGPLVALPGALAARVLNGLLDLRSFAQLVVAEAAVGVVAMAVLVSRWGLTGAVAALLAAELFGSLFGGLLLWRRVARPLGLDLRPRRPDLTIVRRLVRYAGALSLASIAATAASLLVRSEIVRQAGAGANGLYQVAWQVGQNYLGILGVSLWSYGMPKVASQLDDPDAIVNLQNDFLCLAVLLLAPGIVLLLVLREVWIPILYSRAFLPAGPTLAWQLSGELVAMWRQSMNVSLLPRERLGFLAAQGVAFWGGWAALSLLLLGRLGVLAAPVSYCLTNLLFLGVSYTYHRRWLGYRLRPDSRLLLARTLPVFVAAVALAQIEDRLAGRVVPLALVAVWLVWNRRFLVRMRGLV